MDVNSLSHSKWNCKYHIVFAPKFSLKDGTKIYAKDYGKRAFRIWIGSKQKSVKNN